MKVRDVRGLESLGAYLREQRRNAELSLRQLADLTGVSNPYLSQIERGLRKPSAEVLQQLARSLRISAEALYVRAGLLDPSDEGEPDTGVVEAAIRADPVLNERQKRVLLDIYASFRRESLDNQPAAEDSLTESTPTARQTNRAGETAQQEDAS